MAACTPTAWRLRRSARAETHGMPLPVQAGFAWGRMLHLPIGSGRVSGFREGIRQWPSSNLPHPRPAGNQFADGVESLDASILCMPWTPTTRGQSMPTMSPHAIHPARATANGSKAPRSRPFRLQGRLLSYVLYVIK